MSEDLTRPVGDCLWTIDGDRVRMLGIPFGTRMTVVRLGDDRLWIHSPVKPSDERFRAVESLGDVGHVIAPNKLHHLFVAPWAERFSSARTWADPALQRRRSDLHFDGTLDDEAPAAWKDDIDQVWFRGSNVLSEMVFFHRKSRTLIVTDIIQNHEPEEDTWFWRGVKRLNGILAPDGGAPRDWRLTVRDRDAARRARDVLLGWDIERLVLSHGRCIEHDAHAFVRRAFEWVGQTA